MAFNYNLIQQVKQAAYKLAAPVPPEEVTGEKPYVRPPELAPEQPTAIDPQSGMRRDVTERLERDRAKNQYESSWENIQPKQEVMPSTPDSVSSIRLRNFVHPAAPITEKHYPKAYKELQQLKPYLKATDDWAARNLGIDITDPDVIAYNEIGHVNPDGVKGNKSYNAMTNSYKNDFLNLGTSMRVAANSVVNHPVTKGVNNALIRLATPKTVQPKPKANPVAPSLPIIPDTPPNIRRLGGGKNY